MKLIPTLDHSSRALPWIDSSHSVELSLTQLTDLMIRAMGGATKSPRMRQAIARVMLRWPDIRRLATVPEGALSKAGGLTGVQARKLSSLLKLALALAGISEPGGATISTPADALPFLRSLTLSRVERFWVIALDVRARCLGVREIAQGTISGCPVPIRDVFSFLLDHDAHRAIVAHNHPGGSASPSSEDLHFTRELVRVGEALGVPIVDHLIVTQRNFISLHSMGEIQ